MPNPMPPAQCARELARLLDAQTEVCRSILEKTGRQRAMVEERREEDLLLLLSEKQLLIERQQQLSEQARPCRELWEASARDAADAASHTLVERAWNGLRETLDAIVKLEDATRELLEEQKGKVSMDIGRLQRGKIVNKAYGGGVTPPAAARFSDKKG